MVDLPKPLLIKIMNFMTISQNARIGMCCKYWNKVFNSIWLSYDYFAKFDLQNKTQNEINKVFEKSSRLAHIK